MPQIVLTRVDKLADKIDQLIRRGQALPREKEKLVKELQDIKIENVVTRLNIPRGSVHFIENYTEERILASYRPIF